MLEFDYSISICKDTLFFLYGKIKILVIDLLLTPHDKVKQTQDSIIFQFHFPKRFGKILIVSMLRIEHLSISLKSQISVAKKVTIQLTPPFL